MRSFLARLFWGNTPSIEDLVADVRPSSDWMTDEERRYHLDNSAGR